MTYKYTFSDNTKIENENPLEIVKTVLEKKVDDALRARTARETMIIKNSRYYVHVEDDALWSESDGKKQGLMYALNIVKDLLTDKELIEF